MKDEEITCENCGKELSDKERVFQTCGLSILCEKCGIYVTSGKWVIGGKWINLSSIS